MMKSKGFWILFILTVVAVGLSVFDVRWEAKKEEQKKVSQRLVAVGDGEVLVKVELVKPNEPVIELVWQDEKWRFVKPVVDEIDESQVTDLVQSLQKEIYEKELKLSPQVDLKYYGLEAPEKTHRLRVYVKKKDSEQTRTIELARGVQKNYQGKSYVKVSDRDAVFMVGYVWDSLFDRTAFDLRNKRLIRHNFDSVNRLEFKAKDREILLKKEGDQWLSSKFAHFRIDTDKVKEFLTLFSGQVILEFTLDAAPTKAQLATYGLDKPDGELTLEWDGKPWSLVLGKNTRDGNYYFWLKTDGRVVKVAQSDYNKIKELDWRTLRHRREPFQFNTADVNRVHLHWQNRFVESEKKEGKWSKRGASAPDLLVSEKNWDQLLDRLSVLTVEEFIEDVKSPKKGSSKEQGFVEIWDQNGQSLGKWSFGAAQDYEVGARKKKLVQVNTPRYRDPIWISDADFAKLELDKMIESTESKKESNATEAESKK